MSDYLTDMCAEMKRVAIPSTVHIGAASCWIARGPAMCPTQSRAAQTATAWRVYTADGATPTVAVSLPSLQLLLNVEDEWTLLEARSLLDWSRMLAYWCEDEIACVVPFTGE